VRDRAILEVLYSTAIRRAELIGLRIWDVDHARGTVFVRQGKGARDRHVPIGSRALLWVSRYGDLVRPKLLTKETDGLFLSASGEPLCADWLSRTVKAYIAAGAPTKRGSCHLFRHTAATLMLEGGADIRYVSEMLGHAKLETTALYTRVSIAKLRAVHAATHPPGRQRHRRRRRPGPPAGAGYPADQLKLPHRPRPGLIDDRTPSPQVRLSS
jgi:integrase/recombinase XerD